MATDSREIVNESVKWIVCGTVLTLCAVRDLWLAFTFSNRSYITILLYSYRTQSSSNVPSSQLKMVKCWSFQLIEYSIQEPLILVLMATVSRETVNVTAKWIVCGTVLTQCAVRDLWLVFTFSNRSYITILLYSYHTQSSSNVPNSQLKMVK